MWCYDQLIKIIVLFALSNIRVKICTIPRDITLRRSTQSKREIKFTFPSSAILLLFVFATLFVKEYAICRHQEEMPLSGMETNIKENEKLQWLGFSLRLGCACRVCTDYSCDPKMAFSLAGEPGLLISRVNKKNPFFGYAGSDTHTKSKLLFDVFRKGDVYFNTGDLMFQDQENFVYFWDRLGDTFR